MNFEKVKSIVAEHFNYSFDFDFIDIVLDIIENIEDLNDDEQVWEAIDRSLIYTKDQWTVLHFYCTPDTANFNEAIEYLTDDIYTIIAKIKEEM